MKQLAFVFMAALLPLGSLGQPAPKEQHLSLAEQFGAQVGTLVERQLVAVGSVKRIEVKVLLLKDLISGITKSALQLEYDYASSYSQETKVANLDADEIDGLIKSIKELQTNVFSTTRKIYTEVTYRSRTGFEIVANFVLEQAKWVASTQLLSSDDNSRVSLTEEDLGAMLALIEKAKELMPQKG